jgi:hypothetical protein
MNVLLPSSGSKNKSRKEPPQNRQQMSLLDITGGRTVIYSSYILHRNTCLNLATLITLSM